MLEVGSGPSVSGWLVEELELGVGRLLRALQSEHRKKDMTAGKWREISVELKISPRFTIISKKHFSEVGLP